MKYDNPELRQRLAGAYVLGVLHGKARARFERLLREDAELERLVVRWQEDLSPLHEQTPPRQPSPELRRRLAQSIADANPPNRAPGWLGPRFWRPFGLASAALALLLAVTIGMQTLQGPGVSGDELFYVGVLSDPQQNPSVVVLGYGKPWRLKIESKAPLSVGPNSELRIWIQDRETGENVFLTRLPADGRDVRLSEDVWARMARAKTILVSRASKDSGTDSLGGEVLFSGVCVNVKRWAG